jgi:hypothetical protein
VPGLDPILAGHDEGIGTLTQAAGEHELRSLVPLVVAGGNVAGDGRPRRFELPEDRRGVAHAQQRHDTLAAQPRHVGDLGPVVRIHDLKPRPRVAAPGDRRSTVVPLDLRREVAVDRRRPRHDDGVRPPQVRRRLPQVPPRKQLVSHRVPRGVDENQIEIAVQAPMLEAVVQQDTVHLGVGRKKRTQRRRAIGVRHDVHVGKPPTVLLLLVARLSGPRRVAAHGDGRVVTGRPQPRRNPHDRRRLARTAGRDVAHRDDGHIDLGHAAATVEAPVAAPDGQPVQPRSRHRQRAQVSGQGAAHASAPSFSLRASRASAPAAASSRK